MRAAGTIRAWRGLSLKAVEDATGIPASNLSRFERGLIKLGQDNLVALARMYGVDVLTLVEPTPGPQRIA